MIQRKRIGSLPVDRPWTPGNNSISLIRCANEFQRFEKGLALMLAAALLPIPADPQLIADFEATIDHVLNRRNTMPSCS